MAFSINGLRLTGWTAHRVTLSSKWRLVVAVSTTIFPHLVRRWLGYIGKGAVCGPRMVQERFWKVRTCRTEEMSTFWLYICKCYSQTGILDIISVKVKQLQIIQIPKLYNICDTDGHSAPTNEAIVALSRLLNQKLHHQHCKHNNKTRSLWAFFGFLKWIPGAWPSQTLPLKCRAKAASLSSVHQNTLQQVCS